MEEEHRMRRIGIETSKAQEAHSSYQFGILLLKNKTSKLIIAFFSHKASGQKVNLRRSWIEGM